MENPVLPLGRIRIPDERDGNYPLRALLPAKATMPTKPLYHSLGPILDQGSWHCPWYPARHSYCSEQGFCTGATGAQLLASGPNKVKNVPNPLLIYHEGQLRDEWPSVGKAIPSDPYPDASEYGGGSTRGVAKYLQEQGLILNYHWSYSASEVAMFLPQGCVMLGTNWYTGMFEPDGKTGVAKPTGRVAGGHAYLLLGYNPQRGLFRCVSSWGEAWGQRGRFWLLGEDLNRLLREDGEACAAVEPARRR